MLTRFDFVMLSALGITAATSSWLTMNLESALDQPVVETVQVKEEQKAKPQKKVQTSELPDFGAIRDVRKKKQAFFDYMAPLVEEQNHQLLLTRKKIEKIRSLRHLSEREQRWLKRLASRYRVDVEHGFNDRFFDKLLFKVDVIPVSLALAQSANESAWGTSRFATEGNNLFGQWCFSRGCGLVPGGRPEGATYEVRKFNSVAESVGSYIHNLNTHHQYKTMRELRLNKRKNHEPVTGPVLAHGLYGYSIRGVDYVDELIAMIASNDLVRYDLNTEAPEV